VHGSQTSYTKKFLISSNGHQGARSLHSLTLHPSSLLSLSRIHCLVSPCSSQNVSTPRRKSSQPDPSNFPSGFLFNLSFLFPLHFFLQFFYFILFLHVVPFSQPSRAFSTALNYVSVLHITLFDFLSFHFQFRDC